MDAVDPGLVVQARSAVASVDGVVDVPELRICWIGHTVRAAATIHTSPAGAHADQAVRQANP